MRRVFFSILAVFFAAAGVVSQVTPPSYPYPKPRPLSGNTTNIYTRFASTVIPSAFNNENPLMWSVDIAGGLQSRLNSSDRLSMMTNWTEEGAMVYDAGNKWYYAVDTGLHATIPLFSVTNPPGNYINFYTQDGTLSSPRTVNLGAANNTLDFIGPAERFQVNNVTNFNVYSQTNTQYAPGQASLTTGGKMIFGTAASKTKPVNSVWTLLDPVTLQGEFAPQTNLYLADGTLSGNRTVTGGANTRLTFTNFGLFEIRGASTNITGASGSYNLRTPNILNATAVNNQVLTLLDASNGRVDFASPPVSTDTSIYNNDGTIYVDRGVSLTGHQLAFWGTGTDWYRIHQMGRIDINSKTNVIYAVDEMQLIAGSRLKLGNSATPSKTVGSVLTLTDPTTAMADYLAPNNLYNNDGTLTTNRNVNVPANRSLYFNGTSGTIWAAQQFGIFHFDAKTNDLFASEALSINVGNTGRMLWKGPNWGNGLTADGSVLTIITNSTGAIDFKAPSNLYNNNGTLSGDRTVTLGNKDLFFQGGDQIQLDATDLNFSAATNLYLKTPAVKAGTATTGWVLTVTNATTGASEFRPAVAPNLYTADGSLSFTRQVNCPYDLTFNVGANAIFNVVNGGYAKIFSLTNQFYSSNEQLIAVAASTGRLKIQPPNIGTSANGDVLTLIDKPNALVEYRPPSNLYLNDGTITTTGTRRTVTVPTSKELYISGPGTFGTTSMPIVDMTASSQLILRVPNGGKMDLVTSKISAGIGALNQVLTLKNTTTGEAEWENAATGGGPTIYSSNGSLAGNRVVTGGGFNLEFYGKNEATTFPSDYFHAWGWDRFIMNSRTNEIRANQNWLVIANKAITFQTPRVLSIGAANMGGQIFTLNANGTADFQPFTPSGTDKSIYDGDGSLNSDRTVTGAGKALAFSGVSTLSLEGTTAVNIKPPGVASATAGMVLTTDQNATGRAVWAALPAPPAQVNVYNTSSSLTGNRVITAGGYDFQVSGAAFTYLSGTTAGLYGNTSFRLGTPKVMNGNTANVGWALCLTNRTTGESEFMPIYDKHLSTDDASLSGPRNIFGNSQNLTISGVNTLDMNATYVSLQAGSAGWMKIRTPKVTGGTAVAGQVLTLNSDFTAEFAAAGAVSVPTIYSADGTITDLARTVTLGNSGRTLKFQGPGNFSIQTMNTIDFSASERVDIKSSGLAALTTTANQYGFIANQFGDVSVNGGPSGYFYLNTARVVGNGTKPLDGEVLSFRASNNTSEFTPAFRAAGNDTVVTSQGSGTLYIQAPTALNLQTPRGAAREDVSILTYNKASGLSEFLPATASSGTIVYNGVGLCSGNGTTPWDFNITTSANTPVFTWNATLNDYPDFMRVSFRVDITASGVIMNDGISDVNVGVAGNPKRPVRLFGGSVTKPPRGWFRERGIVDMVYDYQSKQWIMINFGIPDTWTALMEELIRTRANVGIDVTNAITAKVTAVSFAGVVDVFADLADVPVNFKKVSTLGLSAIDDGNAHDYILTTLDPAALKPGEAIQSAADPAKMWKRLNRIW